MMSLRWTHEDETVVAALLAVHANKSVREYAALEIGSQFSLDETGDGRALLSGARQGDSSCSRTTSWRSV